MLYLPQLFEPFRPQLEATQLDYINITATPSRDEALTLTQSKFGGYPYLPADFEYPCNSRGEMMPLLAQINFEEMPALVGFPTKGLLQFYATDDEMMGMEYEYEETFPVTQEDYRVIYHPTFETHDQPRFFADIPTTASSEYDFVPGTYTLQFEKRIGYVPLHGIDCKNVFGEYYFTNLQEESVDYQENHRLSMEYYTKNGEEFIQHKVGGYANSVQEDARAMHDAVSSQLTQYQQLLQISSDDHISWGDAGVAHFFIDPIDLQALDFSRVIYYWSCG
ncbi:hypothetical protein BKI52_15315 [marine bacterium AO1-C]|nr:hypothetical protein BKI52_15315 [marine bacterium AO1-C]